MVKESNIAIILVIETSAFKNKVDIVTENKNLEEL